MSHEECQRILGTGFSYETRGIMLCDHGPTHIDAVSHLSRNPNAESIEQLALEKCITPAICIDVSDIPQKTQFGRKKIEDELKKWGLDIRQGETVLFYTAQYDRYYGKPEDMTDYPGLDREQLNSLLIRAVTISGLIPLVPSCGTRVVPVSQRVCGTGDHAHRESVQSRQGGRQAIHFHWTPSED